MGKIAAAAVNAIATHSAPVSDQPIRGPARAEPTGPPTMFRDTETAKARPNLPGSVLRWRSVKKAMSNGVLASETTTSAAASPKTEFATGRDSIPADMVWIDANGR